MRRADRRVLIIKLVFLGVCVVLCGWAWWYSMTVMKPRNACLSQPGASWIAKTRTCKVPPGAACEAGGNWWDPVSKTCAHVVYIPNITGRPR